MRGKTVNDLLMDPLSPLIERLHAHGRLRVWSLVITVFGDSVQHRGGQIATVRLGRLLGRLGIETGAVRTALSRLSRDGWVISERQGRTSAYRLTPLGMERFTPATQRIYAAPRRDPVSVWTFAAGPQAQGIAIAGGRIGPAGSVPDSGFSINGTLSAEARAAVAAALPDEHLAALRGLATDLFALEELGRTDALTAAAARTLLIHRWRRLVLRWPEVPADVMPADFAPRDLHGAVAALYHRLSPRSEAWLDSAEPDMAPMPPADARFALRFGGRQEP